MAEEQTQAREIQVNAVRMGRGSIHHLNHEQLTVIVVNHVSFAVGTKAVLIA